MPRLALLLLGLATGNIISDDFHHGLALWRIEAEKPGVVSAQNGILDIDVPAGVTLWFRQRLQGAVTIEYEASVISAGGLNDRVSDLNCFWMATDPNAPQDLFAHPRTGAFAEYNQLKLYYVGLGGNGNTTTRFRRYVGDAQLRPLLAENDLSAADKMIIPNRWQMIRLVADGSRIEYYRDGVRIFHLTDREPYTSGWFGLRTTQNHMRIRNFRITSD